jgi:hypothetical protein
MCSINHDKKTIFIHIPKTAGSYLAKILADNYGFKNYYLHRPDHREFCGGLDLSVKRHENKIHGTLMYYKTSPELNRQMGMNEEKWRTYYKFCFVRNPYERIVSGWKYCNKYKIAFENFLNIGWRANSFDYWHVFMPQVRHLINEKGVIDCDFIGYYENLEVDLKKVLNKMGFEVVHVPFIKNKTEHKTYTEYYGHDDKNKNNEIYNTVRKIYSEDFAHLKY